MKIAYINPSLCNPDGIERVLISQANYMADVMGYEVYILLTDGKGLPFGYEVSPRVHVLQLDINFYQNSSRYRVVNLWHYFRKMLHYKELLTQVLMRIRPNVTISLLRRELNFLYSIPDGSRKIGWAHLNLDSYRRVNFGPWRLRPWLTRLWQGQFFRQLRRLDTVVVLTEEDRMKWQSTLSNLKTIPNPLSFQTDEVSPLQQKTVIAVGRYAWQKGFDRLIRIWSRVYREHPDWQLHIYGRGNRIPYQQLVNQLQLQESCVLHPFESDVQSLYRQASVFVFPSRYEGFGLTLLEAMHCGLPCVAMACPCGPKDMITSGENGFLAETEESFAQHLSLLLSDDPLRRRMAESARSSSFRFTQTEVVKKWEDLFRISK